jgi:RNA polymerase sigma-70 factor (ECF subfamily)
MTPSAGARLHRAVAVAEVEGPAAALQIVDGLRGPDLESCYLFHAIRADLLRRVGRPTEAARAYEAAIQRATNAREREFPRSRLEAVSDG